jgi:hypothetical protein
MKRFTLFLLLFLCAYFFIGAYLIHKKIPQLLFPSITLADKTNELSSFELQNSSNNGLIVREYGESTQHCLIFFPGQHGGAKRYENEIFPLFQKNHFKVFSISYSGQDGAKGQVNKIPPLIELIHQAMKNISAQCPAKSTVVYGRSLGATVAAFAMAKQKVSGIILESVAPSLSLAIKHYLQSKWYLFPLSSLPISRLLNNDFQLSTAFSQVKETPIAIFQGSLDTKTPLKTLEENWDYPGNVSLHIIDQGLHANTHLKAKLKILNLAKTMVL